jgi:hypothetical protein
MFREKAFPTGGKPPYGLSIIPNPPHQKQLLSNTDWFLRYPFNEILYTTTVNTEQAKYPVCIVNTEHIRHFSG